MFTVKPDVTSFFIAFSVNFWEYGALLLGLLSNFHVEDGQSPPMKREWFRNGSQWCHLLIKTIPWFLFAHVKTIPWFLFTLVKTIPWFLFTLVKMISWLFFAHVKTIPWFLFAHIKTIPLCLLAHVKTIPWFLFAHVKNHSPLLVLNLFGVHQCSFPKSRSARQKKKKKNAGERM